MGSKRVALVIIGLFLVSSASYGWDNLRTTNTASGVAPSQSLGRPNAYSAANQPLPPPVPNSPSPASPNNETMPSDASGWPVYPYPEYHNPFYSGTSPRDLFSGTVEWIVGLPSAVMDNLSNFLDRKVFPLAPATHGSKSSNGTGVQPLYVKPEKPETLPPATPYIKDDKTDR